MRASTTLRLALAGTRVDSLRITLTVVGAVLATLALLSAVTVGAIRPGDGPYTSSLLNQGGLHPGVILAFVGLCLPTLVLLGQCSRIGAPARDRRLSAIRLAGASPRDVTMLVAVESGAAALIGSLLGTGGFFLLRAHENGRVSGMFNPYRSTSGSFVARYRHSALRLPTDVLAPWWSYAAVVVVVPLLVVAMTVLALRRVAFTPFGVLRQVRTRVPRFTPLILIVTGVGVFFVMAALLRTTFGERLGSGLFLGAVLLAFVLIVTGLLSGQGALTALLGRWLARRTSDPALLLAARRMVIDPFAGTRATGVLTVAVVIAAGAQRLRDITLVGVGASGDRAFYAGAYDLVNIVLATVAVLAAAGLLVAAAEGIVARRRVYAAVVAAGTPRAVVGRAVLAELLLPLVPSLLIAAVAGTAAGVGLFGWRTHVDGTAGFATVGIAWGPLALILALGIGITALTTSGGLVFLRRATDIGELRSTA